MPNPLRAETSFQASGKTWLVAFDWNAAAEYEEVAKRPISEALKDVAVEQMSATSLRAMLWAGLQREHAREVSLGRAGELIAEVGRKKTQELMGVALRYYFPEIPAAEVPPDPPPPAASA